MLTKHSLNIYLCQTVAKVTTPGEHNICSLCLLTGTKWKYPLTKLISHSEMLVCKNPQSQAHQFCIQWCSSYPILQCAAVSTQYLLIKVPPHKCWPVALWMDTMYLIEYGVGTYPPTIRLCSRSRSVKPSKRHVIMLTASLISVILVKIFLSRSRDTCARGSTPLSRKESV